MSYDAERKAYEEGRGKALRLAADLTDSLAVLLEGLGFIKADGPLYRDLGEEPGGNVAEAICLIREALNR